MIWHSRHRFSMIYLKGTSLIQKDPLYWICIDKLLRCIRCFVGAYHQSDSISMKPFSAYSRRIRSIAQSLACALWLKGTA